MTAGRAYPSAFARHTYRLLLRLYPRWFRDLFARQMVDDFVELFQTAAASRSLNDRLKCWGVVLRDLIVSAPRERFASRGSAPESPRPPSRRGERLATLGQDVRYAARMLRQYPGFSSTVVITLALGIGANIAMFSVMDGVLFSSLPYDEPERLVTVWNRHAATGADRVQVSGLDFLDYRERATTFEDFAAIHNSISQSLTDDGPAEQIVLGIVSSNFFRFLGREPLLGRYFTPDDEALVTAGSIGPAVISHALWSRRYGSDPTILGRTIYVGRAPMQVIGVTPEDFKLVMPEEDGGEAASATSDPVDVWRFLPDRSLNISRSLAMFRILGRMRPGVTFQQAQQEMDAVAAQLRAEYRVHEDRGMQIDLVPMHADVIKNARPVVLALFGAVGFVLLIACANVANLILARGAHRQREFVVRAVLGADRMRLVRQLLTETTVLAVAGTALGLLLASLGIDTIVALAPANVPMIGEVGINGNVLLFAVGVTVFAIGVFGAIPAARVSRFDVRTQLNDGTARAVGGRFHRVRSAIVIAEIGVSLVLLVGGGLMIRSFRYLQGAHLGFEPTSAITVRVALPHGPYDDEAVRSTYWTSLRREAASLPNVTAAGLVWPLPFGGNGAAVSYSADGGGSTGQGRYVTTVSEATPGFFEAMDARLVDGRTFSEADLLRDAEIVIVDDIVAEKLFPGERAVGRTLWLQEDDDRIPLQIVGVVEHIRHQTITGPEREIVFRPTSGGQWMALVTRAEPDPYGLVPALRQIGTSLDPEIPLFDFRTFDEYLGVHIAPTRFTMTLASVFAVVALVLASVGLYGVISYAVAQRASEIGVRMALGARDGTILRLVLGNGAVMAAGGITLGLVTSLALTRAIRGLLYGVTPTDPLTLAGVSLLLAAVALVASYVPARRAARVDPMAVLRRE